MSSPRSRLARLAAVAATALGTCALATAGQVGHLNDSAPNNTDWAAAIVIAGETPVHVNNISNFDLTTVGVLCINIGNGGPSAALLARMPDLSTWVMNGGVLVYHDKGMSSTAMLPGGGAIALTVSAAADIDVVTTGALLTDGPGGVVDSTTLDGWTATTIGYATNLPGGAINFLSNGATASNSTGFIYPLGSGSVYYAPIPLEFYMAGLGPVEMVTAMSTKYAPNVVAYAAGGGGSPLATFCSGDGGSCPCGNGGAAAHGCGNSAEASGAALVAEGYASIGSSTLAFSAAGLVPSQPGLLFQGDVAVNGGAGVIFGDGLRCAGTNVVRLEVVNSSALGESLFSVDISTAGGVSAGDSRAYQLWYRDPTGSPCGTGFNTSNGVQATWVP